jgi:hypothetical protein
VAGEVRAATSQPAGVLGALVAPPWMSLVSRTRFASPRLGRTGRSLPVRSHQSDVLVEVALGRKPDPHAHQAWRRLPQSRRTARRSASTADRSRVVLHVRLRRRRWATKAKTDHRHAANTKNRARSLRGDCHVTPGRWDTVGSLRAATPPALDSVAPNARSETSARAQRGRGAHNDAGRRLDPSRPSAPIRRSARSDRTASGPERTARRDPRIDNQACLAGLLGGCRRRFG